MKNTLYRGVIVSILSGLVSVLLSACTGTTTQVTPDPDTLTTTVSKKCGIVVVKEVPSIKVYPPAGNLVAGFANALERSGIAEKIYYPSRNDDKFDLALDSRFDVTFDANTGGNMTKSFFTGLTLFLLEPVFWFNFNYEMTGEIDIIRATQKVDSIKANSEGEMSMKFLSLGEAQTLEGSTLAMLKESLFRQLILKLETACAK
jgi:hypothetical protein